MGTYERIEQILSHYEINSAQFAVKVGVNKNWVYDLKIGKVKNISEENAEKIVNAFPEINKIWLLTGEGEMLRTSPNLPAPFTQSSTFSGQQLGSVTVPAEAWAIIQAQAESLRAKDEQISRLITLIEKNSPTSSPSPSAPMASSPSESASSPDPVGQNK